VLGDASADSACCLKAIPRELFLRLPFFEGMHRFLPALVLREGAAVRYLEVTDRPRRHGRSKYGTIDRAVAGAWHLLRVWWLLRRGRNSRAQRRFADVSRDEGRELEGRSQK
jgi:dolichol-phosphate mannosyltransferase